MSTMVQHKQSVMKLLPLFGMYVLLNQNANLKLISVSLGIVKID